VSGADARPAAVVLFVGDGPGHAALETLGHDEAPGEGELLQTVVRDAAGADGGDDPVVEGGALGMAQAAVTGQNPDIDAPGGGEMSARRRSTTANCCSPPLNRSGGTQRC